MEATLHSIRVRSLAVGYVVFTSQHPRLDQLLKLVLGFPASFGVFQNYYSQLPQFAHSPYLSVIGTVASGLGYLGAPIATSVMKRLPKYQRQMIWVGCTETNVQVEIVTY